MAPWSYISIQFTEVIYLYFFFFPPTAVNFKFCKTQTDS